MMGPFSYFEDNAILFYLCSFNLLMGKNVYVTKIRYKIGPNQNLYFNFFLMFIYF